MKITEAAGAKKAFIFNRERRTGNPDAPSALIRTLVWD